MTDVASLTLTLVYGTTKKTSDIDNFSKGFIQKTVNYGKFKII